MSVRDAYPRGECPDCGDKIPARAVEGGDCANCGHVFFSTEIDNINDMIAYFDITNECSDKAHPLGIHRHGWARYARRP